MTEARQVLPKLFAEGSAPLPQCQMGSNPIGEEGPSGRQSDLGTARLLLDLQQVYAVFIEKLVF